MPSKRNDPERGARLLLAELRDLRVEMRHDRRRAEDDRRRADEERRRSDERFEHLLAAFQRDSARREAATQKAFRDIRSVGLSIVKTLNRHTRLLEGQTRMLQGHTRLLGQIVARLDRNIGGRRNGPPRGSNGDRH